MRHLASFLALAILSVKATSASAQVVRDGDINLLPMYGGVEKSRSLRKADAEFLAFCDKNFPSRKEAAAHHAAKGWEFFYANDFKTAIKRYNQAWLLDSTNASAYWGFGVIEGRQEHNTEALRYFQLSLRHAPASRRLLIDISQALLSRYLVTRYQPDLDMAMQRLQEYLTDTSDAKGTTDAYMRLAAAYYFKHDYANAWKYVDQTRAMDASALQGWPLLDELQKASPR